MSASSLSQIFSASKDVQSRALNRAGIQPFRALSARLIYRLATSRAGGLEELSRTGILVLEDFLPRTEFDELREQASALSDSCPASRVLISGGTRTNVWDLPPDEADRFPLLTQWCGDSRVLGLVKAAEQQVLALIHR